jgi:hypothetical protein
VKKDGTLDKTRDATDARASQGQAVGRAVTLLLLPSNSLVVLGPAWATLCGACAADNWRWDGDRFLALVVTLFVTEVLWGSWRAQLVDMDWDSYVAAHPLPEPGDPVPALPYTAPNSPLGRALRRWGQVRRWIRETLPAERRGALLALPILPPVLLLFSALVGGQTFILSLAALALSLLEWRLARRGRTHSAPQAGLEIGLSWLAGHIAFAPLTTTSFSLACCYALAYQGALAYQSLERRSWALRALYLGQAAAVVAVLAQRHPSAPLAATGIGLLLAPQLLLLVRSQSGESASEYLRRAIPFMMIAMPIAAWVA